jgi:hypothetical protein
MNGIIPAIMSNINWRMRVLPGLPRAAALIFGRHQET